MPLIADINSSACSMVSLILISHGLAVALHCDISHKNATHPPATSPAQHLHSGEGLIILTYLPSSKFSMRNGRRAAHKPGEHVQGGPKNQPDYYYNNFVYC